MYFIDWLSDILGVWYIINVLRERERDEPTSIIFYKLCRERSQCFLFVYSYGRTINVRFCIYYFFSIIIITSSYTFVLLKCANVYNIEYSKLLKLSRRGGNNNFHLTRNFTRLSDNNTVKHMEFT